MDPKLAKPVRPKVTMATVFWENCSACGPKLEKATNSLRTSFCPEEAASADSLIPGHPDQERDGGEDVAQDELEGQVRESEQAADRTEDDVDQRDERDKGYEHGPDGERDLQPLQGS